LYYKDSAIQNWLLQYSLGLKCPSAFWDNFCWKILRPLKLDSLGKSNDTAIFNFFSYFEFRKRNCFFFRDIFKDIRKKWRNFYFHTFIHQILTKQVPRHLRSITDDLILIFMNGKSALSDFLTNQNFSIRFKYFLCIL